MCWPWRRQQRRRRRFGGGRGVSVRAWRICPESVESGRNRVHAPHRPHRPCSGSGVSGTTSAANRLPGPCTFYDVPGTSGGRERGVQMHGEELVTVVIPARNEERHLDACLESVLSQDYRTLQVVVVDGDSSDRTAEVVRLRMAQDARVELLHNSRRNIPSSLNL